MSRLHSHNPLRKFNSLSRQQYNSLLAVNVMKTMLFKYYLWKLTLSRTMLALSSKRSNLWSRLKTMMSLIRKTDFLLRKNS